jgi:NADH:ubiquinone oxidoreductase subunit 6 (subunit J)
MADKKIDPDDLAEKAFFLTMIGVVLYGGAVMAYVLNGQATTGVPETDQAVQAAHDHGHESGEHHE